jgi:glutamate-1-semialdehyde 2,1-aminomutase
MGDSSARQVVTLPAQREEATMKVAAQLRETTRFLHSSSLTRYRLLAAQRLFPDGITRETIRRLPYAPYMTSGHGSILTDADGDQRVDFLFNHSALIHGHCYGPVTMAISDQASRLEAMPFPNERETELGRLLCPRVAIGEPYFRFTSSGTEAVMLAVRVATAATGRRKIVLFEHCYHGSLVASNTLDMPSDDHLIAPFNDPGPVRQLFARLGSQIAAVLVDLCPARGALSPASTEFVAVIHAECRRYDALMIADEVVSSRGAPGGMTTRYGLVPDMICLGKYIGGGLPIGALVLRRDLARCFAPDHRPYIGHGGTFNGNPLSSAAGCAALRDFDSARASALDVMADTLCEELTRVFLRRDADWIVRRAGSLFHLWPQRKLPNSPGDARQQIEARRQLTDLSAFLLRHGAIIAPSGFSCLSTATQPADLDYLALAVNAYFSH